MILILIILVLLHAYVDSVQIKHSMHIYHAWETIAFFAACSPLLPFFPFWKVLLVATTTRIAFFDIALNVMRGKSWLYNGVGASVIDRIENKLKIKPVVLRIGGIILFVIVVLTSCTKVLPLLYHRAPITEVIMVTRDSTIIDGKGKTVKSIYVYNASHITIRNITVMNGGIEIFAEGKDISEITISNVTSSNAAYAGIYLHTNGGSFEKVIINRAITDSNGFAGIACTGDWPFFNNSQFDITNCSATGNRGIKGMAPHSGHGIVLANVVDALIDSCYAEGNGWQYGNGNIGIWCYDSDHVNILNSKSIRNISTGQQDGGGFDIDGGSSNCTIADCYSEGNDGAGYLMYEYGSPNPMVNNTFTRNTSVNDGINPFYTAFVIGGKPVPDFVTITHNKATTDGRPAVKFINKPVHILIDFNNW